MGEIAEMMIDGTMDENGEFNFDGEDGPGFPLSAAEAEDYKRSTGWKSRLAQTGPTPPTGRRIHGFWRRIADHVRGGARTLQALCVRTGQPINNLDKATQSMVAKGYLYVESGEFFLTKRCKSEMHGGH